MGNKTVLHQCKKAMAAPVSRVIKDVGYTSILHCEIINIASRYMPQHREDQWHLLQTSQFELYQRMYVCVQPLGHFTFKKNGIKVHTN